MMKISKIPNELLGKRNALECNFIFSLYKEPDLFHDYRQVKAEEDIITEDGIFYYQLGLNLIKAGFNTFDTMSFTTYLSDKKDLKKEYESRGGYKSIQDIMSIVSVENIDTYYDNLVKNNMLIRLYEKGFDVLSRLDKFKEMSSEEVYDWYEYQLADISIGKIDKVQIEDLSKGYDEWVKRLETGQNIGYKIGSSLLDYRMAGIHKGLTLYAGGIGQGKSSSSVPLFILPAIENGNDVCILCNEQTSDEYRSMIIATILFSRIKDVRGMNRMTITRGKFDDDKRAKLKEAAEWLEKQPGKIQFVELESYNTTKIKKIIKKQSRLGCGYFIFDVLKSVSNADDKAWAILLDTSQELAQLAKNEDIAIIATVQLASDSMFRRYLDLSSIGKSRGMAECATTVLGFRPVLSDEYQNMKPYKWERIEGSEKKIKKEFDLNPEKHYIVQFIMKNRWGDMSEQIVQEFDQSFNVIRDVGCYKVPYDNFKRK